MVSKVIKHRLFLSIGLIALTFPHVSWAYVDPGLMGMLFQTFYVLVFGVLAAWVIKPWNYMKGLFKKKKEQKSEKD